VSVCKNALSELDKIKGELCKEPFAEVVRLRVGLNLVESFHEIDVVDAFYNGGMRYVVRERTMRRKGIDRTAIKDGDWGRRKVLSGFAQGMDTE